MTDQETKPSQRYPIANGTIQLDFYRDSCWATFFNRHNCEPHNFAAVCLTETCAEKFFEEEGSCDLLVAKARKTKKNWKNLKSVE